MSKKRVLIVDDEPDLIFAVQMQLKEHNFEILTALDGQEALSVVRRERIDLIILDLMLPKVEGYKVCRMLKFDEKYKAIPIILFSALAQESDQKPCQRHKKRNDKLFETLQAIFDP